MSELSQNEVIFPEVEISRTRLLEKWGQIPRTRVLEICSSGFLKSYLHININRLHVQIQVSDFDELKQIAKVSKTKMNHIPQFKKYPIKFQEVKTQRLGGWMFLSFEGKTKTNNQNSIHSNRSYYASKTTMDAPPAAGGMGSSGSRPMNRGTPQVTYPQSSGRGR